VLLTIDNVNTYLSFFAAILTEFNLLPATNLLIMLFMLLQTWQDPLSPSRPTKSWSAKLARLFVESSSSRGYNGGGDKEEEK